MPKISKTKGNLFTTGLFDLFKYSDKGKSSYAYSFYPLFSAYVLAVEVINSLTVLTSKYEISLEGIKTRSLWRRRSLTWSEIKEITIVDAFVAKGIQISIASSRMPTPLLTAQMGNQEELNKAIIEAFMQAKPSYQLDQATINTYGYPPFGIFE